MEERLADEIARYQYSTDEELVETLGRALIGDSLGFAADDSERSRRFAEHWLEERWEQIRVLICTLPAVIRLHADGPRDELLEATTVVDSLAACFGKPPAASLSLIVVRRGVRTLCE
jgi:hypothetical protein